MRTISTWMALVVMTVALVSCDESSEASDAASPGETDTLEGEDGLTEADIDEPDLAVLPDTLPDETVGDALVPDVEVPVETVFAPYLADGKVVEFVELPRYLGKWYEIATFEILFQTDCTGSTATYSTNDDGTIAVKNECFLVTLDGEYKVDTAVAKIVDTQSNAKLSVQFPGAPKAPYWIIELDGAEGDGEYQWAVVGSSFPIFLWILSRTPQMPQERLDTIKERLIERGYDLSELSYTVQFANEDVL